jgi:hypothetical protein
MAGRGVEDAALDMLETDGRFFVLSIDGRRDGLGKGDVTEYTKLRTVLTNAGVTLAQARVMLGLSAGEKTRAEIVERLRSWLRDRPKGQEVGSGKNTENK